MSQKSKNSKTVLILLLALHGWWGGHRYYARERGWGALLGLFLGVLAIWGITLHQAGFTTSADLEQLTSTGGVVQLFVTFINQAVRPAGRYYLLAACALTAFLVALLLSDLISVIRGQLRPTWLEEEKDEQRARLVLIVLCMLLGPWGAHRYYSGHIASGAFFTFFTLLGHLSVFKVSSLLLLFNLPDLSTADQAQSSSEGMIFAFSAAVAVSAFIDLVQIIGPRGKGGRDWTKPLRPSRSMPKPVE